MSTAKALSEQDLKDVEGRAKAATPGPWHSIDGPPAAIPQPHDVLAFGPSTVYSVLHGYCGDPRRTECKIQPYGLADAAFVAHAREDIPALLAEVQRLRRFEEDSRSKGSPPEIDEAISIILDAADRGDLDGVTSIEAVGTRRLLVRLESGGVVSFDAGEVEP